MQKYADKSALIVYTQTGRKNDTVMRFYRKHVFHITGYIPDYFQKGSDTVILVNIP